MKIIPFIVCFLILFTSGILSANPSIISTINLPKSKYNIDYKISNPAIIQYEQLQWVLNNKGTPQLVAPFKFLGSYTEIKVKNINAEEVHVFKKGDFKNFDFYIESSSAEVFVNGTSFQIEATKVQNSLLIDPSCKANKINFKLDTKNTVSDNKYVGFFCHKDIDTGVVSLYSTHQLDHDFFTSSLFETVGKGESYKKYELSSQIISQVNSKIGFFSWKSSAKTITAEIYVVENVFKSNKELLAADVGLGLNSFSLNQNETNSSKSSSIISYGDISISPFELPSRAKINWYTQISDINSSSKIPTQSSKSSIGWDYYLTSENYEFAFAGYMSFVNAYSFEISAFNTMQTFEVDFTAATFALGRNYKLSLNSAYGFASGGDAKGYYLELSPKLYFVYTKYTLFTKLLWSKAEFENTVNRSKAKAENIALIFGTTY
jgi:hypothetical protein